MNSKNLMLRTIYSNKKVLIGAICSLLLLFVFVSGVFASIPNSSTKIITACKNNSNGGLKVIDAQNGAVCGGSETSLTWSGAQSAVLKLDYDATNPNGPGIYNSAASRNIIAHILVNSVEYGEGHCVHLNFVPKYVGNYVQYSIYTDPDSALVVDNACGTGYEYFYVNSSNQTFFFTE